MIVAAVADLMFSSRIRAAASVAAADVRYARNSQQLAEALGAGTPSLLLLDLEAAPLDPVATVARLKADPVWRQVRIVGFVSHVHSELIAAARAAGIDEVLARSAFVRQLPQILHAAPE